jgi:hypothetical protein
MPTASSAGGFIEGEGGCNAVEEGATAAAEAANLCR